MILLLLLLVTACEHTPTYLRPYGYAAHREAVLGWVLLAIACLVVLLVIVLVLAGIYRHRDDDRGLVRTPGGLSWIVAGGIVVPGIVLLGVLVFTITTLAAVASPPRSSRLTVQVTGHRWWWEVRYPGTRPGDAATTANEIHIPVGVPVRVELAAGDVIHSFWVPQLAGKTDLIPGQRNVTWIEADRAGTYWGQCGEYCGLQHAHMAMTVVAESIGDFTRWLAAQRQAAADPATPELSRGREVFVRSACALCHTIRGTGAGGRIGPDLTHLASRHTIAAGMLPNGKGQLSGWVANPQAIKPGTIMPVVPLPPAELRLLVDYLQSLR